MVFELHGRDAQRYLHNRLTNNVKALNVGQSILAAALTPQGKTQGLFMLRLDAPERYTVTCDGGDRSAVIAGLMRFKVADRVDLVDRSDNFAVLHIVGSEIAQLPHAGVSLVPRQRTETKGVDLLVERQHQELVQNWLDQNSSLELPRQTRDWLRILGGQPEFPTELNEQTLFAESGMREAVSFTKGCYVGQEVIERIDSFGSVPRVLCRVVFESDVALVTGEEIRVASGDGASGKVVSAASNADAGKTACFASLKVRDEPICNLAVHAKGVAGIVLGLAGEGFGE